MQYIKHYYVDDENNTFCCEVEEPRYKRHPWKEYEGLAVKIWLKDSDGVDVCLSELPDTTEVTNMISPCGKNAIQILTESEYNSVSIPYFESQVLSQEAREARQSGDEAIALEKDIASSEKINEAINAILAL